MKFKIIYFLILTALLSAQSQTLNLKLEKGKVFILKNHIVAFGYRDNSFVAYKLTHDLKATDSLHIKLVSFNKNECLQPEADTLNACINFYLHKKNKQPLHVFITDTTLKLKSEFKNIEVTKLKPFSGLAEQTFHSGKYFYIIKSAVDTAGKHFYLSKYGYTPGDKTPFDYGFHWQFNFDRNHISYAKIFYADANAVYVFVSVNEGVKTGQWILIINAKNGLLLKSKRLNYNSEIHYRFCNAIKDSASKALYVVGQITTGADLASATPSIYLAGFDSVYEYTGQNQYTFKINAAAKTKQVNKFLIQIPSVYNVNNLFTLYTDVYKKEGETFKYHLTAGLTFTLNEGEWQHPEMNLKEFPEIENFYSSKDQKDPNGKIEKDSISGHHKLYHHAPLFPVKLAFRLNENNMPEWYLKKLEVKTNKLISATLKPGLKNYSLQVLTETNKTAEPEIFVIDQERILLTSNPDESNLELVLKKW